MYGRPNQDYIDNMYITKKGRGKGTAYESGALVPLVIRGPRISGEPVTANMSTWRICSRPFWNWRRLTPPKNVPNRDNTGLCR